MARPAPRIPSNLFGVPFGVLGLADCWLVAASYGLVTATIGRVLVACAVAIWAAVLMAHTRDRREHGVGLAAALADPVAGPFLSLAVITPTLAAADALYPLSSAVGTAVVDIGIVAIILLGGWLTGQWIYGVLDLTKVHPGYFLPSVAGGLVASASASLIDQPGLAEMLFGFGVISWLVLGSIVLGRLLLGPPLPGPLTPTLAIEVAPAAVATFAWFQINGGRLDIVVRLLAGYGLLMVIAQVRLIPAFRRQFFMPSFWAFTFAWAAVAFAGLSWLGIARPSGWRVESWVTLGLISAFIVAIGVATVCAMRRGHFLPVTPAASPRPACALPAGQAVS